MEKLNEFMEKVKTDEALQKEFAEIIGDSGAELTKEQKEKIAELAAKSGIELNVEGELSDEALGSIVGGVVFSEPPAKLWVKFSQEECPSPQPPTMEWEKDTYSPLPMIVEPEKHTFQCLNCGKIKVAIGDEEIGDMVCGASYCSCGNSKYEIIG